MEPPFIECTFILKFLKVHDNSEEPSASTKLMGVHYIILISGVHASAHTQLNFIDKLSVNESLHVRYDYCLCISIALERQQ